ncbi:flavin reductase family protein [Streptomyces sp. CHD11]|uniref:flavin reductase family protein n=1 Tax=Streptomyces sp. CHD11 TaxID=2741325 RepID=UPI001BFC4907|nr:flavin reductase family protein [Streptomyces sp. CHD11]MBT3155284.1 flavin reductase family protein [Streptomyces sp. CHD11]
MVSPFSAMDFRRTLGQLPTGVTVITTKGPLGRPVGMACNSFMSVSLDPPLVLLCVGNASSTLIDLQRSGAFCVNILASDQAQLCRQFSVKGIDRFAGVPWTESAAGPELTEAIGWMSCSIESEQVAGDHLIVIARVTGLRMNQDEPAPLVFHRGRLGSFAEAEEPLTAVGAPSWTGRGGAVRRPMAAPGTFM